MSTAPNLVPVHLVDDDSEPPTDDPVQMDGWFDFQLQQLAEIAAEMKHNRAVFDAFVAQRKEWLDVENAVLARRAENIEQRIQMHAMGYDYRGKKSRTLPSGKFGTRQKPERVEVQDEAAALAWCEDNFTNGIRVVEKVSLDMKELKALASNGIVPDGCTLIPARDEFYVDAGSTSRGQ